MTATPTTLPGPMGKARTRRGRAKVRAAAMAFAACVGVAVIDAFVGDRGVAALLRSRQDYHRLAAEVAAKKEENALLWERIRQLRSADPAVIEEIARRELGLIKPGERLFIIHDATPATRK